MRPLPFIATIIAAFMATALVLASALAAGASEPEPKRIYIANDEHTDYFWTADADAYRQAFQDMLDYYMAQAEATASGPADQRGRFNCDGSLWVWDYEQNRPPADFARLAGHLAGGTITMPLSPLVLLYGAMPTEAVVRSMYYAGRLERREGLRFLLVVPMEDQTLPGGVASLWAGAGAEYAWKGICGCATRIDAAARPREIYRFRGPDGAEICMKWNSERRGATGIGGYAEARDPYAAVDYLDRDSDFLAAWPWPVAAAFGYGLDYFQSMTDAFLQAAADLPTKNRRVIVSNEVDFFADFLAHHRSEIPVFSGSFGNEWDLLTASLAAVTADFKREVERLRTAEALAAIASLHDPSFMDGREAARDRAFMACGLYYEHDWTADGPVPRSARARFQRDMLADLRSYVTRLHDDALARVAGLVDRPALPPGAERHLVVNPLSWLRTDVAELATELAPPLHVVDVATGVEVPSQLVDRDGIAFLRIVASNVPALGYRVFEVRSGPGLGRHAAAKQAALPAIDNGIYAVTLGPRGEVASLVDHKDSNRELVDAASGGSILDLGSGSGAVEIETSGPVSTTLRVRAGGSPPHETRVTLHAGIDRVEIESRITGNFGSTVAYASAFDLPGMVMRHEEVGMIARVARAASGGDYADRNARTDFLTLNHFVDLSQAGRGVTLSNWDASFFQAGSSTADVLDGTTPALRVVAGMQVDGPGLGFPDQGGDTSFRYRFALGTHAGGYDPARAMRFALEHQNPLVAARLTGGAGGPLPAGTWSLLSLAGPDILVWALKPAEDGAAAGLIVRLWNLAEGPREMALRPAFPLAAAVRTTHIETDLGPVEVADGAVRDTFARQELRTYRLVPAGGTGKTPAAAATFGLRVAPNPAPRALGSTFAYGLPERTPVRITVHDAGGRLVKVVAEEVEAAGPHTATWDGTRSRGERVAPGIYFVQLRAGREVATLKVVRLD